MIRFVFAILVLAALLYGLFWAIDRRNAGGAPNPAKPRPRGPVGPDDDEAFLRNLDLERRRNTGEPPAPPTAPPAAPPTSQETHDHPE